MGCDFSRPKDSKLGCECCCRGATDQDPSSPDVFGKGSFSALAFMPERVNAQICKRYIIEEREIGSGGFGKVFVAEDREIRGRFVAIKKMATPDENKKAAFKTEVGLMKKLDHPHICKLLETYDQGRHMFFVMELCAGGEVFDRIAEEGCIEEGLAADIVAQVAGALKYAHSQEIAHRDLKPENVCFCDKDRTKHQIKVIDWGVGFYFGQVQMNSTVGSLTYAAPEVLDESMSQRGYTSSCDLWSLGVCCYVMLCGKPPFWGDSAHQLANMRKEKYPLSGQDWRNVSQHAKDLIVGLLRKDPTMRLSADAVLAHPWARRTRSHTSDDTSQKVLSNLHGFSGASRLSSILAASVARQLDHKGLQDLTAVFCDMDTNGDGVLNLDEMRRGFEKFYGKGSDKLKDAEQMFSLLDFDGSGSIDYTEFCAAGLGERLTTEEHILKAAFRAFDCNDGDGRITKQEIKQMLENAGVGGGKARRPRQDAAALVEDIFRKYDRDGNGSLDFDEWKAIIKGALGPEENAGWDPCMQGDGELPKGRRWRSW